jgi:6-phosphogluconolactonase
VTAYAIGGPGALSLINQRASAGMRPCHLTVHPEGTYVLVANCGSGHVAVFPVASTGTLGEPTAVVPVATDGATDGLACATFDPGARFVLVCDRTADRLRVYAFDSGRGTLTPAATAEVALVTGAGPRQVQFRLDQRFAYVLNERNSTVTTFAYDASRGSLTEIESRSTLPEYFDGANVTGEIYLHRSSKWLYVSNIGHNSIVLFSVDDATGTLTFVEEQGTGGKTPRQFGIEPSSKHLAISNRDSDTVLASRIDEGNGRLKPSGLFASVPSPAGIRFLPPQTSR